MSPHCSPRLHDYVSGATWRHANMRALFLMGVVVVLVGGGVGGCLLSLSSSRSDNTQHSGVSLQGNECCFYFPHALFIINKAKVIFVTVGFSAATYINQGYNELFGCCFHLFFFGPAHKWEKIFYNHVYLFVFWLINSWNQVALTALVAVLAHFSDEPNSSRQRASALATGRTNGSTICNLKICTSFLCSWDVFAVFWQLLWGFSGDVLIRVYILTPFLGQTDAIIL